MRNIRDNRFPDNGQAKTKTKTKTVIGVILSDICILKLVGNGHENASLIRLY